MSSAVDIATQLAESMVSQAAAKGFSVGEAPAPVAQQEAPVVAVQETAPQNAVEVDAVVDLDPELPEDLVALLEPDEDEEPYVPEINVEETDEWVSPQEVARLKAELAKAQKKAEFADKQRLEASKPKWMKEAEKFFPLSSPGEIEASSRKEFLRKAQEQHEALKPAAVKLKADMDAMLAAERAKIEAEVRAQAEAAWGRPLSGPGVVPIEAGDKADALKKARATGNLEKVIAVMIGNS